MPTLAIQDIAEPRLHPASPIGRYCWALAIAILAGITEKMDYSDSPKGIRGLGMTFMTAGLLAIVFMAFAGISL